MVCIKLLLAHAVVASAAIAGDQPATDLATTAAAIASESPSLRFPPDFSSEPLHVVLNKYSRKEIPYVLSSTGQPNFKNGVFEFNKRVLNRLRSTDRELSNRLVSVAPVPGPAPRMNLVKRQGPANVTSASSTVVVGTTPTDAVVPNPATTTIQTSSISSLLRVGSTSTTEEIVLPDSSASSVSSSSSTENFEPTIQSSSPSSPSPLPLPSTSSVSSSSDATSYTSTTQKPTPANPTTKVTLQTTTLPNGDTSTVTAVAVITPSSSSTAEGEPSLQTGSAHCVKHHAGGEVLVLVAGVAGMAWIV